MELLKQKLDEIFKASGLDVSVDIDAEGKRVNIFITNEGIVEQFMPRLLSDIDHIVRLIAKNLQLDRVYVDVNNYKKERERLIVELAKAAARKAIVEKKDIILPAMNAYERRLVHVELATRPDIKTESMGEGESRQVIIRPI